MTAPVTFREDHRRLVVRVTVSAVIFLGLVWLLASGSVDSFSPDRARLMRLAAGSGTIIFGLVIGRDMFALASPGLLTVSETGVEQRSLGRRKRLPWSEIQDISLVHSIPRACLIYPFEGPPLRLAGWEVDAAELKRVIDDYRRMFVKI